jgi:NitT/TauT family transport system ATP-binding protein
MPVLDGLSFELQPREIFCILGPSGCGKTTLLKLLAGLLTPESGQVDDFFEKEKSFLFQEPRLLPWMTVYENLCFTTKAHLEEQVLKEQIEFYLKEVRLWEYKDHYPDELSGGMQQRIAIVRAFLFPSELMLLDEPFKSLDVEIMLSVMETFKELWQRHDRTVVMITHDVLAAALLGDRIMILSEKPTKAVDVLENPVPKEERLIHNEQIGKLQSTLYRYFV